MDTGLQIVAAFTCENADIKESNAEMDVRGVYFQTAGVTFPIQISALQVAGFVLIPPFWKGRDFVITIVLFDSDNHEVVRFERKMGVMPTEDSLTPMLPFAAPVEGLVVERPETIRVEIRLEGELKAQLPFEVLRITG